jgi:pilus assembly protein CpaE
MRSAVISTDSAFRQAVRGAVGNGSGLRVDLEIAVPLTEIGDSQLDELHQLDPVVIFLDLEEDPQVGLKFAEFLTDSGRTCTLIGAGRDLSPELLLGVMQAGIAEYLPKPATSDTVASAIERLGRKSGYKSRNVERDPGKIFVVFGPKGGCGSTTVATNLALAIHRLTREKTLLLDLNLELGETALLLGVEPRFSVVDLVRNFHRVDSGLLASYIERHESGVELLSAPFEPADTGIVSAERIMAILDFLRQQYDYIVVDTPTSLTPAVRAAFDRADEMYLVATADLASVRNLTRCLPLIRSLSTDRRGEWVRLLVNRYDQTYGIPTDEIERTLGMKVYWRLHNDYSDAIKALNAGKPIVEDGSSRFSRDVLNLGASITGVSTTKGERLGLARKLLGFRPKVKARRRFGREGIVA